MKKIIGIIGFILSIGLFLSSFCSQDRKPIIYKYNDDVTAVLDSIQIVLDTSFLHGGKTKMQPFVKIGSYNKDITMIFNYIENMPSSVQDQIKSSNRFIEVSSHQLIPILFDHDDGNAMIRELGINHGNIGGYLVEFDNYGNVVIASFVY